MSDRLTKTEKQQFSKLWAKAYPAVGVYVTSLVRDYHSAEDIIARISEILIEKIDQYHETCSFEAWAIGVARYEVLKYRRDKARDRLLFDDDLLERIGDRCCEVSREISSRQWGLQQCLKRITSRASEALDLRYGENLHYETIGLRMGMKSGAVRIMLHRTREALRRCIDRYVATE